MLITRTETGYIADNGLGERAFPTLDDLFKFLLRHYEGRCSIMAGEESYGCVKIFRHPPAVMPGRR